MRSPDLDQSTIRDERRPSPTEGPRFEVLTILSHPDAARIGDVAVLEDIAHGRPSRLSRMEPEFAAPGSKTSMPLGHPRVSRSPLRLEPADGGAVRLDPGELPADDVRVDGQALSEPREIPPAALENGVIVVLGNSVVLLLHRRTRPAAPTADFDLVGASEAMERLREQIPRVADVDATILLEGETGTGKERVAQAIHRTSKRSDQPFVSVNMGAVPATVAASQLFGHVKGAFTGATHNHQGFFERAHGGTLFLDEIGETPTDVQPILLRALESGEIQPLGAAGTRTVDVRVIAATDTDLEDAVSAGTFRAPLFHRLAGFRVSLPPLRDRRDDLGRLLLAFLKTELAEIDELHRLEPGDPTESPWLDAATVARLARHTWSGNVRELQNVVRELVLSCRGQNRLSLTPELESRLTALESASTATATAQPMRPSDIQDAELIAALREHQWRIGATARALGISRTSLYALMEQCEGIRTARDLGADEIEGALGAHDGHVGRAAAQLEVSKRALQLRMKELGLTGPA